MWDEGQGCSILPPNAVGLGKKMGSVFPLFLLKKKPSYSVLVTCGGEELKGVILTVPAPF